MHTLPLPGDLVWIRQRRWRVERVRRDRSVVRLDVAHRDARLTFLAPFDRPSSVTRSDRLERVRPQHALARLAHLIGRTYGIRTIASAVDAAIDLLPHQLEPALASIAGARRILIADEVGLGKTIQAGLLVAESTRRDPSSRVLIVVPSPLRDQWAAELRARFRLTAWAADAHRLAERVRSAAATANPWDRPGIWIASLDFLKQPHVFDALPLRPWDLVVVDEAHLACGDSERHEACHEILRRSRRCVLLTATPHSGDDQRFSSLLALGAVNDDALTIFRRTRHELNVAASRRIRWQGITLSAAERRVLAGLAEFEAAILRSAGRTGREHALLLLSVFRKRALSTMGALARSLDRRLAWLGDAGREDPEWLQPSFGFDGEGDDGDFDDRAALTLHSGMRPAHERSWLRRLRALVDDAQRVESKVAHLVRLLQRSRETIVIFTEFRHSLDVLERRLQLVRPLAILHGGQTDLVRRQQLDRFQSGTASILLATDVAGQGLNLQQHARWVISLELPWNPARLEQRIGRVDRIGQARGVHATLLVSRHDAEAGLLVNLARRTLTARRALGDGVLDVAVPDESALRAALIDRLPLTTPPAPASVAICRVWRRQARFIARRLQRGRQLTARWRANSEASRALFARVRHRAGLSFPPDTRTVFAFTVPLLDRAGTMVERHLVVVGSGTSLTAANFTTMVEAARHAAGRARQARVAHVRGLAKAMASRLAAIDRALAARIALEWVPFEAQPGLFDAREARRFEAARSAGLLVDQDLAVRIDRRTHQATLDAGRPVLELVLDTGAE